MGWIVVLIILMVLACFPIGVCAKYNAEGPMVALILGPVRFTVFPRSKEKKKKKENKSRETNTSFKYHRHSGISSIISIKRRKKK